MTTIVKTNSKGEIKIPIEFRKFLGINPKISIKMIIRGRGLLMYPVIPTVKKENSYLEILAKTKGSWSDEVNLSKDKKKIELAASKNRKLAW